MAFKIPSGVNKVQFSIRVDEDDFKIIDKLATKNKKSYNYIVNCMVKYAIDGMKEDELKELINKFE